MSLSLNTNPWYKAKVIPGKQVGRTLGFPTVNLDNPQLLEGQKEGVYACLVKIDDTIYQGVLYYGPRLILKEKKNILEIFLFDFDKEIYHQTIIFILKGFIRGVENFQNLEVFKKQLAIDCSRTRKILLK